VCVGRQLADLQLIPDKCNKELSDLTAQLDALNSDKQKEEQHLQEVMDSFKSETEVCVAVTPSRSVSASKSMSDDLSRCALLR